MPAVAAPPSSEPTPIESFVPSAPPDDIDAIFANRPEIKKADPPKQDPKIQPKQVVPPKENADEDEQVDIKLFVPEKPEHEEDPKAARKQENSKIREELKKVLEEKAERERLLEEAKQQYSLTQQELEQIRQSLAEKEALTEDLQKKIAIGDPNQHPSVREIEAPWFEKRNDVVSEIGLAGEDPNKFNQWTYAAIRVLESAGEPGTETYRTAVGRIRNDYLNTFPNAADYIMPAIKLVRDGVETTKKKNQFVNELQSNLPAVQFKEQTRFYEAAAKQYEADERNVFNPPDDIKINDPLNPSCILKAMIDGSDEVRSAAERTKAVVRYAMLPLVPINPDDIADRDDSEKMRIITEHNRRYTDSFMKLRSRMAEAFLALQVLPSVMMELEVRKSKDEERSKEPKPKLDDSEVRVPVTEVDIKSFIPEENIELKAVKSGRR